MVAIEVRAETAGVVWQVLVRTGEPVAADEPLLLLESMKMEIPVCAARAGRVVELRVAEGDIVAEDQVVAILATG